MKSDLIIRAIQMEDCAKISKAFQVQGWEKPVAQYERYFEFQKSGDRDIIVAALEGDFAGYLTINWKSEYPPFQKKEIPEIVDFNVLQKYQRLGIGTKLMDEAERRIKKISAYAGIGFGVYQDYGKAQILYIKRGYIPDGNGLVNNSIPIKYGEEIKIDDSIVLYLTKQL